MCACFITCLRQDVSSFLGFAAGPLQRFHEESKIVFIFLLCLKSFSLLSVCSIYSSGLLLKLNPAYENHIKSRKLVFNFSRK